MSASGHCFLPDEQATEAFGAGLARALADGAVIHLQGGLGAGKTTLCRGLLRALGHRGTVKSPTYTLVEPYEAQGRPVFHFDLYRLALPAELEGLGIRDYLVPGAVLLIEWPERGGRHCPPPDLIVELKPEGPGRLVDWRADSPRGEAIAARLDTGVDRA